MIHIVVTYRPHQQIQQTNKHWVLKQNVLYILHEIELHQKVRIHMKKLQNNRLMSKAVEDKKGVGGR